MKNKENKTKEEILDLQIFLTRSPRNQAFKYKGLPSFLIYGEERRTRDIVSRFDIEEEQQTQSQPQPTYIAVANSSIVEEIKFPFSPEKIIEMITKLNFNEAKLVECMEFGIQLFNFAIHGSIKHSFL